jgi:hypothetical protein
MHGPNCNYKKIIYGPNCNYTKVIYKKIFNGSIYRI